MVVETALRRLKNTTKDIGILVRIARLAEFRGQSEASDILLKLHQKNAMMPRGVLDRESSNRRNDVPIALR